MNAIFFGFGRASAFGLAALVVVLGVQWLLDGRVPASWRVWLWRVVLLQSALALLPLAPLRLAVLAPMPTPSAPMRTPLSVSPLSVSPRAPRLALPAPVEPVVAPAPDSSPSSPAPAASSSASPVAQIAPAPHALPRVEAVQARAFFDWRRILLAVYAMGLAGQLALLARSLRRVRRMLHACAPVENAAISVQLSEGATRIGLSRLPRLLESEGGAPFLVGVFRPIIVLPGALLSPNNRDLETVLAHELAHQKRRDLVWNAVLWPIQTLLWFHPLVWIARRFLALETESACDEMVLSSTSVSLRSYGVLLLNTMNTQQTPLTAGVADGFATLKTRIERLNRAPKRPRRAARIAFVSLLCSAFGALVPVRFVARAQVAVPVSSVQNLVSGTVRDAKGKPLAGAMVYALPLADRGNSVFKAVSDANGAFRFSSSISDKYGVSLFVDAGVKGFGAGFVDLHDGQKAAPANVYVVPTVGVRLLFLDPQGRPVPNSTVRLRRVGQSQDQWMDIPPSILTRLKATTNAVGVANFPHLPSGRLAQFKLGDEISKATKFGLGDLRGGQFAPLSTEDFVRIGTSTTSKTIHLVAPITIKGHVSLPEGGAAGNVLVLARRINAAEAASKSEYAVPGQDFMIAQTRSNAAGEYVLNGLRPGKYYIWIYPEKRLTRDYMGRVFEKTFLSKTNTQDFALSRGALVQGVVLSQATKQPVKGQTMWLFDSQENNQYTITDARGFFQFRTLGGNQRLRVHANGQNSPPPGFILPAKSQFDFEIQNGQKREFKIELLGKAPGKPLSGTVVGTDGKLVAGATVQVRAFGKGGNYQLERVQCNARGHFTLTPKQSLHPVRLWADAGELTTAHGTIAVPGDDVTLQLEANAWASVAGRVEDAHKKPLRGVRVQIWNILGGMGENVPPITTGADGSFRFDHLRPESGVSLQITRAGYEQGNGFVDVLKKGETHIFKTFTLRTANATLAGQVLESDGTPARRVHLSAEGMIGNADARTDGRFFLPQVIGGPLHVWIYRNVPKMQQWGPFPARGNQKNLLIRLSDKTEDKRLRTSGIKRSTNVASLLGQMAPELRVASWKNGAAQSLSSLRGKVVVLDFGYFDFNSDLQLSDFARSFQTRGVRTIGVQASLSEKSRAEIQRARMREIPVEFPFPIALDMPSAEVRGYKTGSQTWAAYNYVQYVVIGRDGRVLYAGDELDRAISFAASALK